MTEEYTTDSIWSPAIRIRQPARGYRFALDAVLLAQFIRCGAEEDLLEVGCGSGVVAVLLSHLQEFRSLTCVEIQTGLAELARLNLEANRVRNTAVVQADIREYAGPAVDLVFSNPPYRKAGAGRLNPQAQKAIARHEIRMTLGDLFAAADRMLKPAGRMTTILPHFRESDWRRLTAEHGFHARELRQVHSFAAEPPAFFLATISRDAGKLAELPPLVIYDSPGVYTDEMSRLLTRDR